MDVMDVFFDENLTVELVTLPIEHCEVALGPTENDVFAGT